MVALSIILASIISSIISVILWESKFRTLVMMAYRNITGSKKVSVHWFYQAKGAKKFMQAEFQGVTVALVYFPNPHIGNKGYVVVDASKTHDTVEIETIEKAQKMVVDRMKLAFFNKEFDPTRFTKFYHTL